MKIITEPESLRYQNLSLNRGLQVFTSLISTKDKFLFLPEHINRLLKGADYLFPQYRWKSTASQIHEFFSTQFRGEHYFRAMIFDDTFVFTAQKHAPKNLSCRCLKAFSLRTPSLLPEFLKVSNYLIAESELRSAGLKGYDEVLFFSDKGLLCEASTSNVFLVTKDQIILTPRLNSMTLAGVTRLKLIEFLNKNDYYVEEADLTEEDVLNSSEIWLTNSVSGVRFIERYENSTKSSDLHQSISHLFGRYGENYE